MGLALLILLPLCLRLWPIGHGLPANYLPDTHVVNSALGMAREANPVPPVGRYSTYPYLLPYCLLPIYASQYAWGRVRGAWSSSDEFGRHLLEHPAGAHLTARLLVAFLAAATTWIVHRAALAMGLRAGAWVAAWLVATGLLHLQFSLQERPWAPLVTFMALAVWGAALHARSGRRAPLLLSGVAAGLAFATHQAGVLTLGIPGLAWALGPLGWRGEALRRRLAWGTACVALFALVSLLLGHPYYLVHGGVDRDQVAAGAAMGAGAVSIGGQAFVFDLSWRSVVTLGRTFFGYDPVLVVLGVGGLALALRSRAARPAAVFALLWAALFMTNHNDHVRYLLPLAVLLAWPAGMAAEVLWRRPGTRALLLVLLAVPLVQALRLGWVLRAQDTRDLALARMEETLDRRADFVAIDFNGPFVAPTAWSLETLRDLGTRGLYAREAHRLETMRAGDRARDDGWNVVRVEDLFGLDRRSGQSWAREREGEPLGDDPGAILRGLGITHMLLVDRSPGDGRPTALLDPTPPQSGPKLKLLTVGRELFRIRPGTTADARLPVAIGFPLTQLWQTERPGPEITLHVLGQED